MTAIPHNPLVASVPSRQAVAARPASFGVYRSQDLAALGYNYHSLRDAVERGVLQRLRVGWYATSDAVPLVARSVQVGGALSGAHRLGLMGGWVPHCAPVQVWLTRSAKSVPGSWVVHGRPEMTNNEIARGVVPWEVALQHHLQICGNTVDRVTVVGALRMPLRQPCIEPVRPPLARLRHVTLQHHDGEQIWQLSGLACENGFELHVATMAATAGLKVEAQFTLPSGRRLDLLLEGRVAVEVDGSTHHTGEQHAIDLAKAAEARLLGIEVLHFTYRQVMEQPEMVIAAILAALGA